MASTGRRNVFTYRKTDIKRNHQVCRTNIQNKQEKMSDTRIMPHNFGRKTMFGPKRNSQNNVMSGSILSKSLNFQRTQVFGKKLVAEEDNQNHSDSQKSRSRDSGGEIVDVQVEGENTRIRLRRSATKIRTFNTISSRADRHSLTEGKPKRILDLYSDIGYSRIDPKSSVRPQYSMKTIPGQHQHPQKRQFSSPMLDSGAQYRNPVPEEISEQWNEESNESISLVSNSSAEENQSMKPNVLATWAQQPLTNFGMGGKRIPQARIFRPHAPGVLNNVRSPNQGGKTKVPQMNLAFEYKKPRVPLYIPPISTNQKIKKEIQSDDKWEHFEKIWVQVEERGTEFEQSSGGVDSGVLLLMKEFLSKEKRLPRIMEQWNKDNKEEKAKKKSKRDGKVKKKLKADSKQAEVDTLKDSQINRAMSIFSNLRNIKIEEKCEKDNDKETKDTLGYSLNKKTNHSRQTPHPKNNFGKKGSTVPNKSADDQQQQQMLRMQHPSRNVSQTQPAKLRAEWGNDVFGKVSLLNQNSESQSGFSDSDFEDPTLKNKQDADKKKRSKNSTKKRKVTSFHIKLVVENPRADLSQASDGFAMSKSPNLLNKLKISKNGKTYWGTESAVLDREHGLEKGPISKVFRIRSGSSIPNLLKQKVNRNSVCSLTQNDQAPRLIDLTNKNDSPGASPSKEAKSGTNSKPDAVQRNQSESNKNKRKKSIPESKQIKKAFKKADNEHQNKIPNHIECVSLLKANTNLSSSIKTGRIQWNSQNMLIFHNKSEETKFQLEKSFKFFSEILSQNSDYPDPEIKITRRNKKRIGHKCLFCNKSDFMLINKNGKSFHLFCLIFAQKMENFFSVHEQNLGSVLIFLHAFKESFFGTKNLSKGMMMLKFPTKMEKQRAQLERTFLRSRELRVATVVLGQKIFDEILVIECCSVCDQALIYALISEINFKQGILTERLCLKFIQGFYHPSSKLTTLLQSYHPYIWSCIESFWKSESAALNCYSCGVRRFHAICGYFNANQMRLARLNDGPAFPGFLLDRNIQYEVSGQCKKCSEKWAKRRNKGDDYLTRVEFLRRFPVNAKLIKDKMNFSEFVKQKDEDEFRLE